jgi:hypothetical protein
MSLVGLWAVLLGFLKGYVGYILVAPGQSLIESCVFVSLIALVGLGLGWRVLRKLDNRASLHVFAIISVLVSTSAIWWTWAFAMPAAMSWDSSATPRAVAALKGIGLEKSTCINVTTGSIGPLNAPYRQCAINGPPGSMVSYDAEAGSTVVTPYRGLIFSYAPASSFSDECDRHLVGHWYAFTSDPSGMTGYTCNPGP